MSAAGWYDPTVISAGVIGFAVFMYVLLDGFDLGVGILFLRAKGDAERDIMMNSVATAWDGNETWLVLGGGGLLALFPLAYAVLLEALYLPLIVMLLALIFRGIAFEFRFKSRRNRHWWDRSFAIGSTLATFAQGLVLARFVQGFAVEQNRYAGGPYEWLSGFGVVCGLSLVAGYALLGATWIVMKTEGELQDWARSLVRPLLLAVVVGIGIVSLWTPFLGIGMMERWFGLPNVFLLWPVPILVGLCALRLLRAVQREEHYTPFLLTMALFLLAFAGLGISLWPNIIPHQVDIWTAAAPPRSQAFVLVGVAMMVPLILGYTAWSYWIFRGKIGHDAGYH